MSARQLAVTIHGLRGKSINRADGALAVARSQISKKIRFAQITGTIGDTEARWRRKWQPACLWVAVGIKRETGFAGAAAETH